MKCRECPDYAKCVKESNLKIKRKSCKKAKTEYVMTNADRIRSMTDDELNDLFHEIYDAGVDDAVSYEWGHRTNSFEWTIAWLKQPAE